MLDRTLQVKVVDARAGATYQVGGNLVTLKSVAADTNGAFALFEILTPPGGGFPPHRQRYDDEAVWVLDGIYAFLVDDHEVVVDAGGYVFVPRGVIHGYTNRGHATARMLVFVSPGGIHERFFAEVGDRVEAQASLAMASGDVDLVRLAGVARKYGIEVLLPPD